MRYLSHHGTNNLSIDTCAIPSPQDDEVLVKVHAFGVNRADLLQREGKYPAPKGASDVLGLEVAGVVEHSANPAFQHLVGQPVCAMLPGGGYAEYVVVPGKELMPIPEGLSMTDAAGLPETFLTAYQALFWLAKLQPKQRLLVHAGASGVGLSCIQLAKQMGALVATTASSPEKQQYCLAMGADLSISYQDSDWFDTLKNQWGQVDAIVDMVAGSYGNKNLKLLAMDGHIVQLAMLAGRYEPGLDVARILQKRAHLVGSTLRNRDPEYKARLVADFAQYLPLFSQGKLKVPVDTVFSWRDVDAAHQRMKNNDSMGKFVVSWQD